jgi:hypothetical protein
MPQHCKICHHPDRVTIEESLRSGASYRVLALRFSVSKDSLARHRQTHLSPLQQEKPLQPEDSRTCDADRSVALPEMALDPVISDVDRLAFEFAHFWDNESRQE